MPQGLHLRLKKAPIILLMVFLCFPCSIKRELKQAFNLPVAESFFDTKSSFICSSTVSEIAHEESVIHVEKQIIKQVVNVAHANYQRAIITFQYHASFPKKVWPKNLPIFILHEQYLI